MTNFSGDTLRSFNDVDARDPLKTQYQVNNFYSLIYRVSIELKILENTTDLVLLSQKISGNMPLRVPTGSLAAISLRTKQYLCIDSYYNSKKLQIAGA